MLTMYFCVDGHDPVIRCWSAIPRIGETVALAELESIGASFKVTDVVWDGDGEAEISIYLKRSDGLIRRIMRPAGASTPCNRNDGSDELP